MPSKNNLSALKQDRKPKPILPSADQVDRGPTTSENLSAEPIKKKTIGRPRKDPKDKRDYKVTLSLTKSEGMTINEKAGLAGEATYLYDLLKKAGAFD